MNGLLFEEVFEIGLDFLKGKKLLIAFSGGKDSLSMLDFLNENKSRYSLGLVACHVNHGLREESGEDELFCKNWCEIRVVEFTSVKLSGFSTKEGKKGIEDWARRERYKALERIAGELRCDNVLTAHTFDDRLESFFTDLYTGASIFTLGGISLLYGKIYRPMLEITGQQVEDYLKRRKLVPVFDKSNDDVRFVRNRIRHRLMPHLYETGGDFVNTVLRLQEESTAINADFLQRTDKAVICNAEDLTTICKKVFMEFSHLEQTYLLGKLFSEKFRASKHIINEALTLFDRFGSKRIDLPDGFICEVSTEAIRIFKKSLIELFSVEKDVGTDTIHLLGVKVIFYGDYVKKSLVVRNRRKGDRLGAKKLKDIFIDKKIDMFLRDRAVIIESETGEILWAEGVSAEGNNIVVKRLF